MTTYYYNYKFKDLVKAFLGKKKCPFCGQKMKLIKEKTEFDDGPLLSTNEFPGSTYDVKLHCFCPKCNRQVNINDLKFW